MQSNYRGLAFLLSLGSLPLACTKDDNDTEGGSSSGGGTNPTGASDTTATDATTTGASVTTTATTSEADTGVETQPTTAGDTGTETDTGVPTPTDPICIAYGEHYASCFPPRYGVHADVLAANCEYLKSFGMADGQPCVDALDAFFVCLTMTECAELMSEDMPPCTAEEQALITACPMLTDSDTDTGG